MDFDWNHLDHMGRHIHIVYKNYLDRFIGWVNLVYDVIFLMEIYNDKQSKHRKNTHIKLHHIKHLENAKIYAELSL